MSTLQQWTPTTLGELLIFTGGSQPPLSVFSKTEHEGYIRLIQIRDYKTDKYTTYIPRDLARRFCDADDIMIGRYGPPIFQILRGLEGAYNVALIKVTPKENILKDFAWHYLRNDRLFKHIDKLSRRTSGQTGVDLNELENYPIQLPPLAEQQKIAQALTDADNYISTLEKLIKKKKMMKEGLMVNLLTGKQRLKEFAFNEDGTAKGYKDSELGKIPEDWNVKTLKEITASFKSGFSITAENIFEDSSLYPVYGGNGLRGYTSIYTHDSAYTLIGRQGALCGNLNYIEGKNFISEHAIAVNADTDNDTKFLFFNFARLNLNKLSEASAQPGLSVEKLLKLQTVVPPLAEQKSIAQTITHADEEISKLDRKLDKAVSIKEGMMQKLLTGEIRLA